MVAIVLLWNAIQLFSIINTNGLQSHSEQSHMRSIPDSNTKCRAIQCCTRDSQSPVSRGLTYSVFSHQRGSAFGMLVTSSVADGPMCDGYAAKPSVTGDLTPPEAVL